MAFLARSDVLCMSCLNFQWQDTNKTTHPQCDDKRTGHPGRDFAVCFTLVLNDKCMPSLVKRYTIHILKCLQKFVKCCTCMQRLYGVTWACHDSRAGQPGGLLLNSPAFAKVNQFVMTGVIRLTIHFVSLQCCDMLCAVTLCHHFGML